MKGKALMNTVGNMDPSPYNDMVNFEALPRRPEGLPRRRKREDQYDDMINPEGLPRRRKRGRQYDSPSMANKRLSGKALERKRREEESDRRVAEYRSGKRT